MRRPPLLLLLPLLTLGLLPPAALPAAAAQACLTVTPPVGDPFPDCSNHQVFNVLPPGSNGLTNIANAAQGSSPHESDQLGMYSNLKKVAPNLAASNLTQYYKDAGFTVALEDVEQVKRFDPPHDGTVIVWDKSFGVPHIYGRTRADTEFGVGYAAAHDRLFLMDVLRHIGRSRLAQFVGPSQLAIDEDCTIAQVAGYSEEELTYQAQLLAQRYKTAYRGSTEGQQITDDGLAYVGGINQYINEAVADPAEKMPVEYGGVAPGQNIPRHWEPADVVAVAAIVQSIFAVGGGNEIDSWFLYKGLKAAYPSGDTALKIWQDLRRQNDALAPTTLDQSFPYMNGPSSNDPNRPGVAQLESVTQKGKDYVCGTPTPTSAVPRAPSKALTPAPSNMHLQLPKLVPGKLPLSNALIVDAAHSASGHPVAVFGPQVAYFVPEILHEEDIHGPGIHARGATFPGTDIYVELGHGVNYAWSATSAGSDLIDQRVELVCDPASPNQYKPGASSGTDYWYNGACRPMYERNDQETALPSPAAPGAPLLINYHIERTVHGPVIGRGTATVDGGTVPVAFAVQRSTWFDELGSATAFLDWNDPGYMRGASAFLTAAAKETGTFNWHYLDSKDIAYYSSGQLPQRPATVNPNFPSLGTGPYDWAGLAPVQCGLQTPAGIDPNYGSTSGSNMGTACGYTASWLRADGSGADPHPHAVNPPRGFLAQWNNKPAPDWSAADNNFGYGSLYRVMSLSDRIRASMAQGPVTPVNLVNDMEDGGAVDLHGSKLIEPFLTVLNGTTLSPEETAVANLLHDWWASGFGAHRRAPAGTNYQYLEPFYAQGNAVAVMDKLYYNLIHAIFDPWFSSGDLYARVTAMKPFFDATMTDHRGSSYDESSGGWESYINTALRQELSPNLADRYSQQYCGTLSDCRVRMKAALDKTIDELTSAYGTSNPSAWSCSRSNSGGGQCNPSQEDIHFSAVGVQTVSDIAWINRPTFQQVVQFGAPQGAVQARHQAVPGLPATGAPPVQADSAFRYVVAGLLLLFVVLAAVASTRRST